MAKNIKFEEYVYKVYATNFFSFYRNREESALQIFLTT